MAAEIEMLGTSQALPSFSTHDSTVQPGGGGGDIEIFGTEQAMSHTPIGSEQKGGGGGTIDMLGSQQEMSHTPESPHGYPMAWPSDKGEK